MANRAQAEKPIGGSPAIPSGYVEQVTVHANAPEQQDSTQPGGGGVPLTEGAFDLLGKLFEGLKSAASAVPGVAAATTPTVSAPQSSQPLGRGQSGQTKNTSHLKERMQMAQGMGGGGQGQQRQQGQQQRPPRRNYHRYSYFGM